MPLSKIQLSSSTGRRNLVINGDMKVAQRGTGPTQVTNSAYFGPDRYRFFVNGGGAYTVTQDSGHQADTGHDKALKIAVTTADTSIASGDYYTFLQRIESSSLQHLRYGTSSAKSLTFSFWVRATKTGTQAVFFSKQGTGTDYNHIKEYTINASNTWEYKTITIPGLTASTMANDSSTYLQFGFMLKYGSSFQGTKDTWTTNGHFTTANAVNNMDSTSNTFYVTGVQLEVGDTATEFEYRSYAEELSLCQRYFEAIQVTGYFCTGNSYSTAQFNAAPMFFKTKKRSTPNITFPTIGTTSGTIGATNATANYVTNGSVLRSYSTPDWFQMYNNSSDGYSGFNDDSVMQMYSYGYNTITAESEL